MIFFFNSLWAGQSRDRIPQGARFSTPVQTDFGAHPASCAMSTGSFPGAKRLGHGVNHHHHHPQSSADVKERVELYLFSPSGSSWPVLGWIVLVPLFVISKGIRELCVIKLFEILSLLNYKLTVSGKFLCCVFLQVCFVVFGTNTNTRDTKFVELLAQ